MKIFFWYVVGKKPAHGIRANPFGRLVEDNHIAFRLVHGCTIFSHECCVAKEGLERCCVL